MGEQIIYVFYTREISDVRNKEALRKHFNI